MNNKELTKKVIARLAAMIGLVAVFMIAALLNKPLPMVSTDFTVSVPGIVIDPGHGGYDGGAVWGGVIEKNVNLDISLHLRELLLATGYRVAMTRYGDYSLVELAQTKKREDMLRRLAIIEQFTPDLFICIHCNAINSTRWSGGQVFCQHEAEQGLELAKDVQFYLCQFTGTTREASSLDHFLLRESSRLGCLVETGFLSNREERELLQQEKYQRRLATAIWLGLSKYKRRQP